MKLLQIVLLVFVMLMAASGGEGQTLDWRAVENLKPNTRIWVKTHDQTYCYFLNAKSDKLFCEFLQGDSSSKKKLDSDLVFNRKDIREVRLAPHDDYDSSKGYLNFLLAAGGGGGWDYAQQPNAFAGVKIGGPFSVDLQFDRIQGHNGFSTEGSAVIPIFRVPRYRPFSEKTFVKMFAEPGLGYRAGGGPFGGYSSAKAMAVLLTDTWSETWAAPYIEFQRRFPFDSPLQGDNRLTFGMMIALCESCGFN
ncbi:MAG: hypothetical protein ABSG96_03255 [Terracidiphilus sp.]|jgi:hypothetical protein